jgi:hypothetical protein
MAEKGFTVKDIVVSATHDRGDASNGALKQGENSTTGTGEKKVFEVQLLQPTFLHAEDLHIHSVTSTSAPLSTLASLYKQVGKL